MSRSFFNALSGVTAYQNALQVVSDNVANLNTNAYRRSEASFTELLYHQLHDKRFAVDTENESPLPIIGKGTHMYPVTKIHEQGPLQLSDQPLDLAIEGRGFFRVIREDGTETYTRRGAFYVDETGTVVTDQGDYLDVDFDLDGVVLSTLAIGFDGQVNGYNTEGEAVELGSIPLYTFVNEGGLNKESSGLFTPTEASGEPEEGQPGSEGYGFLRQYHLEGSNVNLAMEMVHLIANQRALQANVRSLITADELKALTLLVRG